MKYMFENGEAEKVNPILIDKAIGFFLENRMMGDILQGCKVQRECAAAPAIRADYVAEDTCIETKTFMKNSRPLEADLNSLLYPLDSNKRILNVLLEHYKRVILLVVCEEGVDDGSMEGFSLRKVLRDIFEEELNHGIEVWVSEVRIETDGIALLSCQKVV